MVQTSFSAASPQVARRRHKIVLFSAVKADDLHEFRALRFMPLSIMALGSVLHEHGFDVRLIDIQVDPDWRQTLMGNLDGALLFGVSCLTGPSIAPALEALALVKGRFPSVCRVWGGYHATLAYREILREGHADVCVLGPGEDAMLGLANALTEVGRGRDRFPTIPNLAFHAENGAIALSKFLPIQDMNGLPPMNYDLINVGAYFADGRREVEYVSSYGCPNACTFCAEPSHSRRRFQALAPERVVSDLIALWNKYRPQRIAFADPSFSADPARVVAIVKGLAKEKIRIPIFCDMTSRGVLQIAKKIDLRALYEVGIDAIYLGLESGSSRVLQTLRKNTAPEDSIDACRLLDDVGIGTKTSFIHDFPEETAEDSDQTFALAEELCRLKYNRQSHHFFVPFPSTQIYTQLFKERGHAFSQADWSTCTTFSGCQLWKGRPAFRRDVVGRLRTLCQGYPHMLGRISVPVFEDRADRSQVCSA